MIRPRIISWDVCKERYTCAAAGHFHTTTFSNYKSSYYAGLFFAHYETLRISKKVLSSHQMGRNLSPFFLDKKSFVKLPSPYIRHAIFITLCTLGPRAYWFYELYVVFRSDFLATYTQKVAETPLALSFCIDMHGQLAALKILPREAFTDHPK